jgi:4-hydroxybenzoyl-CoA thioesterase
MPFTSIYKIRFDDVDGAGILYYPRYFHLCHQALEDSFDRGAPLSYPELIHERRLGLPTVAVESNFTAPLEYGDTVTVSMTVESIGTSSLILGFRIQRESDGAECFHARITTVLTDLDSRKSTPFPDELRFFFEGFRAD